MARPMSSDSDTWSGHSACGPAMERTKAVVESRSSRSAFNSASTLAPPLAPRWMTATRPSSAPPSISAFMASMANPPGANVTSPRRRKGFWLRAAMSLRPCSQVVSTSGSEDSAFSAALKPSGGAPAALAPRSDTRVAPGARNSSRRTVQTRASLYSSALMSCSGRPPSVTCSVASSICAGIGNCGMPDSSARIAGTARTGSALLSLAANRSASSCRADSDTRSKGDAPKRTSPLPASFSARSSAP